MVMFYWMDVVEVQVKNKVKLSHQSLISIHVYFQPLFRELQLSVNCFLAGMWHGKNARSF